MTVVVAALAGFLTARLLRVLLAGVLTQPALARVNVRGVPVPTAAGIVVAAAAVAVEAGRAVVGAAGVGDTTGVTDARALVLVVVVGLALFGAVDDLLGAGDARGFRGHLARLAGGELTTGGLKLVGGAAVALVACGPLAGDDLGRLLLDAALVALAANLGNLFDRAPGRALKASTFAFVVLVVATTAASVLAPVAVVVGAGLGLLLDDLHERVMLGDTGANALGGAIGFGVVLSTAPTTRTGVLAAVAALNLAAEVVSFSRVIDAVAPLRALDRLGRRAG